MRPDMCGIWRLKYQRWRLQAAFNKDYRALQKRKASRDEFQEHDADEYFEIRRLDEEIDRLTALQLWREGNGLDLELPGPTEEEMWTHTQDGQYTFLSIKGRAHVRKLVDAEKARRFEVKTLWVTKFWLPLLAALVGIIGAVTGLVAVCHKK